MPRGAEHSLGGAGVSSEHRQPCLERPQPCDHLPPTLVSPLKVLGGPVCHLLSPRESVDKQTSRVPWSCCF